MGKGALDGEKVAAMERVASYGRESRAVGGPLVLSHAHLLLIGSFLPEIQTNLAFEDVTFGEI